MKKLLAIVVALTFAAAAPAVLAADAPKEAAKAAAKATLEKPANVTADAWAKMSDADKAKAVEAANKTASTKRAKKEKKGGC